MKIKSVPTLLIGAALALSPAVLCAQMYPAHAGALYVGYANPKAPDANDFSAMDKHFLKEAAMGGMAEVKLGQLAADKGGTDAVKDFGNTMVKDHTALNDAMKPFLDKAGVAMPDALAAKDQALYDRLSKLNGAAFDSAYAHAMVNDHTQDKAAFDREARTTKNEDLRDAVKHGDEVIAHHLAMANKLASSRGKSDQPGM